MQGGDEAHLWTLIGFALASLLYLACTLFSYQQLKRSQVLARKLFLALSILSTLLTLLSSIGYLFKYMAMEVCADVSIYTASVLFLVVSWVLTTVTIERLLIFRMDGKRGRLILSLHATNMTLRLLLLLTGIGIKAFYDGHHINGNIFVPLNAALSFVGDTAINSAVAFGVFRVKRRMMVAFRANDTTYLALRRVYRELAAGMIASVLAFIVGVTLYHYRKTVGHPSVNIFWPLVYAIHLTLEIMFVQVKLRQILNFECHPFPTTAMTV